MSKHVMRAFFYTRAPGCLGRPPPPISPLPPLPLPPPTPNRRLVLTLTPQPLTQVCANILAGTIVELSALLTSRVAPGGVLLLSGIWGEQQVEKVQQAFADAPLAPFAVTYQDGWALLEAERTG